MLFRTIATDLLGTGQSSWTAIGEFMMNELMSAGTRGIVATDEARIVSHAAIAVAVERTESAAEPLFQEATHSGRSAALSKFGGRADALRSLLTVAVDLALAIGAWLLIYGTYLLFRSPLKHWL
jgi:hypothetical protein